LVVIDLDVAKPDQDRAARPQWRNRDFRSGADVLTALAGQAGHPVPETYTVATASGGRHLYFTAPGGVGLRNSAGRLGPMIDVRGEGGYVVAAGSRIHNRRGRAGSSAAVRVRGYRLLDRRPPVELPGWLPTTLTADRRQGDAQVAERRRVEGSRDQALDGRSDGYGAAALRAEVGRVRSAPVGRRNHTLNTSAYSLGQLIAAGHLHHGRVVEALTVAAESAGLETAEIRATIESGLTAGARRPRIIPARRKCGHQTEPTSTAGLCRSETQDIDRADNPAPPETDSFQGNHCDGLEDQHLHTPLDTGAQPCGAAQPRSAQADDTAARSRGDGSVTAEELDRLTPAADEAKSRKQWPNSALSSQLHVAPSLEMKPAEAEPGEAYRIGQVLVCGALVTAEAAAELNVAAEADQQCQLGGLR
jgi:hypothetical protein